MHISPAGQANLATFLPLILTGLLLFGMVKWGGAKPWQVAAAALAGVVLSGSILGPTIHNLLAAVSAGHLH